MPPDPERQKLFREAVQERLIYYRREAYAGWVIGCGVVAPFLFADTINAYPEMRYKLNGVAIFAGFAFGIVVPWFLWRLHKRLEQENESLRTPQKPR